MPAAHHQAPYQLGEGLTVAGWSPDGEVTEALEVDGHRFGVGVHWHPEEGDDLRLLAALRRGGGAAAARRRRRARAAAAAQAGRDEAQGRRAPVGSAAGQPAVRSSKRPGAAAYSGVL